MQNKIDDLRRRGSLDKALVVFIACISLWATKGPMLPVLGAILFIAVYVGWDIISIRVMLERMTHEDKDVHISEGENNLSADREDHTGD